MAGTVEKVSDEQAMRDVMALLDGWQVPEPSPWFDSRMMARFREEKEQAPQGFFARIRDRFLFSSAMQYKPLLAGAMALLLVAGGGSYLETSYLHSSRAASVSATVQDLQVLDNNDQAIQQMDQLLDSADDNNQS